MTGRHPAIVVDSTISLPAGLLQDLPIFTAPCEIHHAGRVYSDGIDLGPAEFYDLQRGPGPSPTTSAPQPGAFLAAFQQAARQSDQIICLTISSDLSSTYSSALAAAEEAGGKMPGVQVHVVDSRTAGPAEGLIALEAARQAAAGGSTEEVLADIRRQTGATHLMAYMETLYWVWRSGRVPRVALWLGNLLDVKPILQLSDGRIQMLDRPRTRRRAMDRLEQMVGQRLDGAPGRVAVTHAAAPEQAQELAERIRRSVAVAEMFVTELTPVIGAHTGPGLVGCAFSAAG